ncbi:MAG: diguanylate cyclase [Dorea sp.]|jgi:diguanylate cyclase (GGDEF)-like protein|nr:diguanylate cyclase [Dorea sp.]MCI9226991.1 diguanylate cyclase [Dorea sp.]
MGADANKNCELLFEYLRGILYDSWIEQLEVGELSEPYRDLGKGLQYLQNAVNELVTYSTELSKGNLSVEFPKDYNFLCENLKNLHANLNHLTWQAQQVTKGDYSQHVAFLGEFSDAFNEMTRQLKDREEQLKEAAEKAERRAEMIEGYNELLVEMLSRRKEWLLVVDKDTSEIIYCNKRKQVGVMDGSFCATCKRRLSFQSELLKWNSHEQYKVWEMEGEADTYYRVTSFQMEWKERSSYVHVVVDITDEKRNARNLTSQSYQDPLTGIKNRLFFEEYMGIVLRDELEATLCYLQLDGLEYVNDTFGHHEGDEYIQKFVEIVKKNFRGGDTFTRIDGDEFCVILSGNMADLINRKLAEILKEFQEEVFMKYQRSFSYGVLEVKGKENKMTVEEILELADDVLYECRSKNRAKYPTIFSD